MHRLFTITDEHHVASRYIDEIDGRQSRLRFVMQQTEDYPDLAWAGIYDEAGLFLSGCHQHGLPYDCYSLALPRRSRPKAPSWLGSTLAVLVGVFAWLNFLQGAKS